MEEKKKTGILIPIILFLLVLGVIGIIVQSCSGGEDSDYSSYNPNNKYNAWICVQDLVEKKLKSPSTAKFPTYSSTYVTSMGGSDYEIKAYVDAQNGFGATVRTYFTATLTLSGTGYINGHCLFD